MDFWNRALRVWWGQLSGDALGSMAEFWSASDIRGRWPEGLRAIGASSVWGTLAGQLTDDSEMAIALGQALLESATDTVDWNCVAAAYRGWYESRPFDMGRTVAQAVSTSHACATIAQDMRAAADRQSQTNGALMRQSILGIWGYRLDERTIAEVARQDAQLTHPHPVCQESSAVYVAAIAQTIRWELDPKSLYDYAVDFQTRYGQEPTVLDALVKAQDLTPPYSPHQGHVLTALHNAFYRLLHSSSLEDVIVDTVAMGGDTDSNAAIAAALCGAVYGENAIPDEWQSTLRACHPSLDNGAQHPRPEQYWPGTSLRMVQSLWDRIPEVEKYPEILTMNLTLADVPPPQSSWSTIANFAFNYPWDQVGQSDHSLIPGFREATALWKQSGCLPKDLNLLRQYLFVLQRSIRWNEGSITNWDDGPEIRYARAYVDAIRQLL